MAGQHQDVFQLMCEMVNAIVKQETENQPTDHNDISELSMISQSTRFFSCLETDLSGVSQYEEAVGSPDSTGTLCVKTKHEVIPLALRRLVSFNKPGKKEESLFSLAPRR